jgi:hypothetical protein
VVLTADIFTGLGTPYKILKAADARDVERVDQSKIIKLNGVSFEWKDGYDKRVQNKTNLGVIAQDVQKVIPEIVKERKDGYLAVQYDQLVPVLIEAVKDQQKQIDELRRKIEDTS